MEDESNMAEEGSAALNSLNHNQMMSRCQADLKENTLARRNENSLLYRLTKVFYLSIFRKHFDNTIFVFPFDSLPKVFFYRFILLKPLLSHRYLGPVSLLEFLVVLSLSPYRFTVIVAPPLHHPRYKLVSWRHNSR